MARRVQPGDRLAITATEYNRILAAAEIIHRDRLGGGAGARTYSKDASTVRVRNVSAMAIPIGGAVGFISPIGNADNGPAELARFVRDATVNCQPPQIVNFPGRVGIAIEPIAAGKVGRVVFDGVVAARVNIEATWHTFADASNAGSTTLESRPGGCAQILWRRSPTSTGQQWAVVRIGPPIDPARLVKIPAAGIAGRTSIAPTVTSCETMFLDSIGRYQTVLDASNNPVMVPVHYHGIEPILFPSPIGSGGAPATRSDQYRVIVRDCQGNWTIPYEERSNYIVTFVLTQALTGGSATATVTRLQTVSTLYADTASTTMVVRDPLGVFSTLKAGDKGLALLQGQECIAIQAPCPAPS